jgi:hypothetical protein
MRLKNEGNSLVIFSILRDKQIRKIPICLLILNLSIIDLMIVCLLNGYGKIGKFNWNY